MTIPLDSALPLTPSVADPLRQVRFDHTLDLDVSSMSPVELVDLNRLKDEFLACVSHELRSPLTALLGLSQLLQDPIIGTLNDRQRRYVQLIHRSGKQLINIVNDILDLTRMETGEIELHPMLVSVPIVCQQALEQAQHRIPNPENVGAAADPRQLPSFKLEVDPDLETLIADPTRLQQILRHLLSNALKFTPPEGQVGLRVARWEGWVSFTVWDTGIGIPAEKQHLIFQKFQQLEHPLTRQFEGTGLGLVLTQRLARLQGGDITFTSREGKGSEFTLLVPPSPSGLLSELPSVLGSGLPPIPAIAPPIFLPAQAPVVARNRMVLVVESGVRNLNDLIEQLTELDYRVAIARSGTEALEKVRKLQPCAVLLNPSLPLLSGWDVLTLLKAHEDTEAIPVIITDTTTSDELRAHESRVDGFLRLPVSPRALADTLEQVLQPQTSEQEVASRMILCLHLAEPEPDRLFPIESFLHSNHFRVVEAHDCEQAELLARVWKPQVLLLVGTLVDPTPYLRRLVQQTCLASLPIITLDTAITQAAIQTSELAVFPCLHPNRSDLLLQTIDVAIGFAGRPLLLMVDSAQWQLAPSIHFDWIQALLQYLHTAGLQGTIAHSTPEMQHKLRSQGVDLLLIYWHDGVLSETLRSGLALLNDQQTPPVCLILDYRTQHQTPLDFPLSPTTQITTPHPTMDGLLQQIQHCLGLGN